MRVFPNEAALAQAAADVVAEGLAAAIAERGRADAVLAGGRTPRMAYALLARRHDVDWRAVHLHTGDERCVPPDHEASNGALLHACFVIGGAVPAAHLHRMFPPPGEQAAGGEGLAEQQRRAARAAEAALPERADVLLLGLGADGHVASLFPGESALDVTARRVTAARAPVAPHARLTITPPVIAAARRLLVLVSGYEKAEAVFEALHGSRHPRAAPGQLARHGTWLLDREAARLLPL